jgi:hypothetical protein
MGEGASSAAKRLTGRACYTSRSTFDAPSLAQPLGGGAPYAILPWVAGTAYAVVPDGIYYVQCRDAVHPEPNPQIHLRTPSLVRCGGSAAWRGSRKTSRSHVMVRRFFTVGSSAAERT